MKTTWLLSAAACAVCLTSCAGSAGSAAVPMIGLQWYMTYDAVKDGMQDYTLLDERESAGTVAQKMQDYENVELFSVSCDLTLCFTDSGLIGLNYHDVAQHQSYRAWQQTLEAQYGLPTEEGSGMASWYDNPVGKNTAVYLFNLKEGVQVSIYVTADSPDKSYEKEQDGHVPSPEIRTPIVPVRDTDEPPGETTAAPPETGSSTVTTTVTTAARVGIGWRATSLRSAAGERTETDGGTAFTDETETTAEAVQTDLSTADSGSAQPPEDHTRDFLPGSLQFYGEPADGHRAMAEYTQLYEYRTEEPGEPWELIMEYRDVPYLGRRCDAVLCYTSRGLVGVSYFDADRERFHDWTAELAEIYGAPDTEQPDYAAWSGSPVGSGTMIYVFALEDGVQISFFADDSGSELS